MKFCTECGSELQIGTSKFCPSCGHKLWTTEAEVPMTSLSSSKLKNDDDKQAVFSVQNNENNYCEGHQSPQDERIANAVSSIHSLGVKLEEMVEQILKCMGYHYTERRKKMIGNSSIAHEIDVFAVQANNILGVECKNYGAERKVGTEEIRNFQSKIEDLPKISHKLFVTNSDFTLDASKYANHKEIELWKRRKINAIVLPDEPWAS